MNPLNALLGKKKFPGINEPEPKAPKSKLIDLSSLLRPKPRMFQN